MGPQGSVGNGGKQHDILLVSSYQIKIQKLYMSDLQNRYPQRKIKPQNCLFFWWSVWSSSLIMSLTSTAHNGIFAVSFTRQKKMSLLVSESERTCEQSGKDKQKFFLSFFSKLKQMHATVNLVAELNKCKKFHSATTLYMYSVNYLVCHDTTLLIHFRQIRSFRFKLIIIKATKLILYFTQVPLQSILE